MKDLRPCLLPLGSVISQNDFNARVSKISAAGAGISNNSSDSGSGVDNMTPAKEKKKKRKGDEAGMDDEPPTTGKKSSKKEKKTKKKFE